MFPKRKKQTDLETILLRHRTPFLTPAERKSPFFKTLSDIGNRILSVFAKLSVRTRRDRTSMPSSGIHVSRTGASANDSMRASRTFDRGVSTDTHRFSMLAVSKNDFLFRLGDFLSGFKQRPKLMTASAVAIAVIVVVSITSFYTTTVSGATYTWIQTQWSTLSVNTTGHPAPGNWTEYSETTGSVVTGSALTLSTAEVSDTQNTPSFSN